MFEKLGRFFAKKHIIELEGRVAKAERAADQRYAQLVMNMDPFEPLMQQFHGVFSTEFEHPEDQLSDANKFQMKAWAYSQRNDPFFTYFTEWIMNTQGNETLKRAVVTPERVLYGRAQISTMLTFVKQVGRLANLYEEEVEKKRRGINNFNDELTVE